MMIPQLIRRPGFYFGIIAALLATAVMMVLGELWRTPVVPQMLSDRMTAELPLDVFARIMETFESTAKPIAFAGIVIGQLLVGGLIGLGAESALRRGWSPWAVLATCVVGLWLVLGLIISPLGGIGIFARDAFASSTNAAFAYFVIALAFGAPLMAGVINQAAEGRERFDPTRRRLLRWVAIGTPAIVATLYLGRYVNGLATRSQPKTFDIEEGELPPAITPTEDFYIVSKNVVDPVVSADTWSLSVAGEVDSEIEFTYEDILAMDAVKQITTLECVSNTVGGEYISNAEWTGIPLIDLLEEAGLKDNVVDVALYADDDYSDSIPLEKARNRDVLLAYEINGEALPDEHGFPLRLVVPGIYGMKHVKWIKRIEAVPEDFQGFWQERGWADDAPVMTMSKIVTPFYWSDLPLGEQSLIGGVAFSGDRGVSRVEVSVDGGNTWQDAEVEEPLSDTSWVRWSYWWTPQEEGVAEIVVRAYEGDGTPQIEEERNPLPAGSTGLHLVRVNKVQPEELEDEEDASA